MDQWWQNNHQNGEDPCFGAWSYGIHWEVHCKGKCSIGSSHFYSSSTSHFGLFQKGATRLIYSSWDHNLTCMRHLELPFFFSFQDMYIPRLFIFLRKFFVPESFVGLFLSNVLISLVNLHTYREHWSTICYTYSDVQ